MVSEMYIHTSIHISIYLKALKLKYTHIHTYVLHTYTNTYNPYNINFQHTPTYARGATIDNSYASTDYR